MVELRKTAFGVLLFGVVLNAAMMAVASVGLDDALGVSGSTDPTFGEGIQAAMTNLDLATNSFEVFLATIQIASVVKDGFLDFIFVVPVLMTNLGLPSFLVDMTTVLFAVLYMASLIFILIGRSL